MAADKLKFDNLYSLGKVFQGNGWDIIQDRPNSRFSKYARLLEHLEVNEQKLILELTKRFKYFDISSYKELLCKALEKILMTFTKEKFYVFPAMVRKDAGKIKSATTVYYQFRGDTLGEHVDLKSSKFHCFEDEKDFSQKKTLKKNEKILIVDDFIGSGETMVEVALDIMDQYSFINQKDIVFLSLVAHEKGIKYLNYYGCVDVFYALKINRGISDYYEGEQRQLNTETMQQIEAKIKGLKDKFKFGYEQCEALLHMERIPNNTFPIYWCWKGVSPYKR